MQLLISKVSLTRFGAPSSETSLSQCTTEKFLPTTTIPESSISIPVLSAENQPLIFLGAPLRDLSFGQRSQ